MAKAGPKWRKSPPELIAAFDAAFPTGEAERRQMFGYPAGFVNGNMFTGLFQDEWMVRLGEADRAALLERDGAHVFEPMPGRPMREYVILPPGVIKDRKALAGFLAKALTYARDLPGKSKAKKTPVATKSPVKKAAAKTRR
jgi:hypothetical protein